MMHPTKPSTRYSTALWRGVLLSALATLTGCGGGGMSLIAITPTAAQTIDAGQSLPITVSVVNDSSHGGARYALTGIGNITPGTLTVNGDSETQIVTYTSPAGTTPPASATFTATSVNTPSQVATLLININPALVITRTTLPNGVVGTKYSQTITATGGTGAIKFSLVSGTLPTSLTLTTAGLLSGKPTAYGTFNFTIGATDTATTPNTVTQAYTVIITPTPPAVTTKSPLPNGTSGVAYSDQLTYVGGSAGTPTFAITAGSLPASSGLTLSSTGLISGTPTTAAAGMTYTFSIDVTIGSQTSPSVPYTLTITPLPGVTTTTLPNGNVGAAYSQQLTFTGGNGSTPTFAIVAGSLPASSGLTLSTSGLLSGTPAVQATYSFSVTVTVGPQTSAPQALTLVINGLIITSATTATGEAGLPFSFHLTASGGKPPYTWTLAAGSAPLPAGLTLAASTGILSGTPTTSNGSPFTGIVVQATDTVGGTATQPMTFVINPARSSANNSALKGQYAFLLNGFDATGKPLSAAGEFTADGNGNVLTGVMDINGTGQTSANTNLAVSASTYSVGPDLRGKIVITTSAGSGTYVLAMSTVSNGVATLGYMTEFDASGRSFTGIVNLQTATAFTTPSFVGGFTFGVNGFGASSVAMPTVHRAEAGELQFTGTGGISSGEFLSSASNSVTPSVISSANLLIAPSGRGTLSMVVPNAGTFNYAVYVVSSGKLLAISTDPASGVGAHDLLAGQFVQQTTTNGNFNLASLNSTDVARLQRLSFTSAGVPFADVQLGLYTFNGTGTGSFTGTENAGGTMTTNTLTGTYTVAANGRVALNLSAANGVGGCVNCVSSLTFAYLIGANQGFVMNFNSGAVNGFFEPQTATTFSGAYDTGTLQPLAAALVEDTGAITTTSATSFTETLDQNAAGTLSPDAAFTATGTTAAGVYTITRSNAPGAMLFVVSPTKALLLDSSATGAIVQEILHQ